MEFDRWSSAMEFKLTVNTHNITISNPQGDRWSPMELPMESDGVWPGWVSERKPGSPMENALGWKHGAGKCALLSIGAGVGKHRPREHRDPAGA